MEKILHNNLPEIVFSSSNSTVSRQINKYLKESKLRKLSPRIYTSNFDEAPGVIIKRNLLHILGSLYPGSLLSHRSALDFNADETVYVTYKYDKKIQLPGVTIKFKRDQDQLREILSLQKNYTCLRLKELCLRICSRREVKNLK